MDFRPPNGFLSFLQDQRHPMFPMMPPPPAANQQPGFQYPMFPMMPPPAAAYHHPFSSTSDPRSPAPPSGKRKRVTVDLEVNEEEKQRLYYTKEEDIRLVGAWLRNSVNPIEGNAKKKEYYWKEVCDPYNNTTESDRKRDIKNLKNHWYKTTPKVKSFNGCYNQIRDTNVSGRCDKQLLLQALDLYHSRNGHQFMYVHWWEAVKDSQKWKIHVYTEGDGTKRSPPTTTDEAIGTEKEPRPMGTKAAKKAREKEKEAPAEMNGMKEQIGAFLQAQAEAKVKTEEMMELQSRLSAEKVEANRLAYEAAKERTVAKLTEESTKLFDKFTQMLNTDTSKMEPWAKEMHVRAVTRLGDQLFKEA